MDKDQSFTDFAALASLGSIRRGGNDVHLTFDTSELAEIIMDLFGKMRSERDCRRGLIKSAVERAFPEDDREPMQKQTAKGWKPKLRDTFRFIKSLYAADEETSKYVSEETRNW